MILGLPQLRALAELKRRQTAVAEARAAFLNAEAECWRLGVSHRQIAAVSGESQASTYRRLRLHSREEVI